MAAAGVDEAPSSVAPLVVSDDTGGVGHVGVVTEVRRYPVKSMLGETLREAIVTERGVDGDRIYALHDPEENKIVSVKRPKRWGRMFELTATTDDGIVHIRWPSGKRTAIDDAELSALLSAFFGRTVSIVSSPFDGAFFDETWESGLKGGAAPYGGMPSRDEDGDETIVNGGSWDVPGGFFNFGAIHIVTTSTVRALTAANASSRFDAHRFRPNIVVDTREDGFVETDWQDRTLVVGDVELGVTFTVPRCVMTIQAQGDLPADRDVLRTITRVNQVPHRRGGVYPCVGVYAKVRVDGTIRVGDRVTLT